MTEIRTVGVVGAGTMGRGILQLYAAAGLVVRCFDMQAGAAAGAVDHALGMLGKAVEKGRMTPGDFEAVRGRVHVADAVADLADCDLVVEAIVEDLAVKQALFVQLESVVRPDCLLASNTSSLTVAAIASACRHPARVAGLHFFNPVPLMKVVEVIASVRTAPETVQALCAVTERAGHRAVVVADQPGFLLNHAGRGLYTEGLRILEEQVATPADVDDVLRDALGFRMGPFELLDLTGLDVSAKVMTSMYEQFQQEPRFRPSTLVAPRVAAGLFGRKTGEGWYRYEEGRKVAPPVRPVPALVSSASVWIEPGAAHGDALRHLASAAGVGIASDAGGADLLLVQPWGDDATTRAVALGLDATRTVAVDPLPPFDRRRTAMLTAITTAPARDLAWALLASDGVPVTTINDSPGFIAQRVLATIVNIACNIAQRGIASVADMEAAVPLGLAYPRGPLGWGDWMRPARVLEVLQAQVRATGDPRYRPSGWLTRRVALGVSLLTEDTAR